MDKPSGRLPYNPSIEHLRLLFAILVVFIHTYGHGLLPGEELVRGSLVMDVQFFFSHILSAIAVPGFFLISGYLYFANMERWSWGKYVDKTRQRALTLLVPYVVWNALKLITLLLPAWISEGGHGVANVIETFGGWRLMWDGNPHYPAPVLLATWFLRDLMVFCLMAPLIYPLVRRGGFFPFLLLMACDLFGWWPTEQVCSAHHLAFFVLGATFSIHGKDMFDSFSKYRIISYIAGTLSLVVVTCEQSTATMLCYLLFGTVAVCNLINQSQMSIESLITPRFTQASMFIYLGHSLLLLSAVAWGLGHLLPFGGEGWTLLRYFLIPLLTIAILLVLFRLLRTRFPRILFLLLGRKY